MQLGKLTYQSFLQQRTSEEISPLASLVQQRLAVIEDLEHQIALLKEGEEEQDFLDSMF